MAPVTNPAMPPVVWIGYDVGIDRSVTARPVHTWVSRDLVHRLAADPDWQAWWLSAPRRRLDLLPCYTRDGAAAPQVLVGRRAVRVEWRADGAALDITASDITASDITASDITASDIDRLTDKAVRDLTTMLEAVRCELQLAPLPPMPAVPAVPADLPDTMDVPTPPDPRQLAPMIAERAGVSLEFALKMLGQ
jgi:hypothetical protein